jgi:hypothetical protein
MEQLQSRGKDSSRERYAKKAEIIVPSLEDYEKKLVTA